MHLGEHINLLILLVQQVLQLPHFSLQRAHSLLQGFRISTRKCSSAELIARLALEADVGTLRAAGADPIAAYLLAAAPITGLGNSALRIRPNLDHFHRQDSRHLGGREWCLELVLRAYGFRPLSRNFA